MHFLKTKYVLSFFNNNSPYTELANHINVLFELKTAQRLSISGLYLTWLNSQTQFQSSLEAHIESWQIGLAPGWLHPRPLGTNIGRGNVLCLR